MSLNFHITNDVAVKCNDRQKYCLIKSFFHFQILLRFSLFKHLPCMVHFDNNVFDHNGTCKKLTTNLLLSPFKF